MLGMGILLIITGILNLMGHIGTIHWYNRRRVSEEDAPAYGRAMGAGTLVIGVSLAAAAILRMVFDLDLFDYLTLAGIVIGLALMLFPQLRYNRGIF